MIRTIVIAIILSLFSSIAVGDVYVDDKTSVYGKRNFRIFNRIFSGDALRELNAEHAYGQNCLLMYLMDDGDGSVISDYSSNETNATLTNGSWVADGIRIDEDSEIVSASMPAVGNALTVMMIIRSVNGSGQGPTGEHGKFFTDSGNQFQLYRSQDKRISDEIASGNAADYYPDADIWDTSWHSLIYTIDDSSDSACLYIDGDLITCREGSFSLPTLGEQIGIGNRVSGNQPLMATIRAFYAWSVVMDADDVESLHEDPFQMFTVSFPQLYSSARVSWEYDDDSKIDGFYVYAAKTQLGFQLIPENIICVAGPQERSCIIPILDCHAFVGATAFVSNQESELSDTPEFLCE